MFIQFFIPAENKHIEVNLENLTARLTPEHVSVEAAENLVMFAREHGDKNTIVFGDMAVMTTATGPTRDGEIVEVKSRGIVVYVAYRLDDVEWRDV